PQAGSSILISSRGGTEPRWSPDGTELFFRSGTRIMSASHHAASGPGAFGAQRVLFSGAFDYSQDRNWTPSSDGGFVMIKADPTMGRQLRVVFNWFEELNRESKPK
ncbi:MAG TPA: hypothetical protein VFP90_05720, partial [Gemmatimonadaceae bacterium]|nr:hypothetical protein [Gemmatimonadaceae bacterium]